MNIYELHGFCAGFADRERGTILSNVELETRSKRLFPMAPIEDIADFKQSYLIATKAGDISREYDIFRNAFDSMVDAAIASVK